MATARAIVSSLALASGVLGLLVACNTPRAETCEDGSLCAPGRTCVKMMQDPQDPQPDAYYCASGDEVKACAELAEGDVCGAANGGTRCESGACQHVSECGNYFPDLGEQCDDGNVISGDGCSATCKTEVPVWNEYTIERPPQWANPALGYDADRDVVMMFGGSDAAVVSSALWELDANGGVREVPVSVAPAGSLAPALAYDPKRRETVVLDGNLTGEAEPGELWLWNGVAWRYVLPVAGDQPPVRNGVAMAWDPARELVIAAGGKAPGSSVWATAVYGWNGAQWSTLPPLPRGLSAPSLAYDVQHAQLVVIGASGAGAIAGYTLGASAGAWSPLADLPAPTDATARVATDPSTGRVVLVISSAVALSAFTLEASGWVPYDNVPRPDPRLGFGLGSTRDGVVLYGGEDGGGGNARDDRWTLTAGTWTADPVIGQFGQPLTAYPHAFVATDLAHHQLIARDSAGGLVQVRDGAARPFTIDNNVADRPTDTMPDATPLVYNEFRDELLFVETKPLEPLHTWTAQRTQDDAHPGQNTHWTWTKQPDHAEIAGRTGFALAYDAKGERVVMVGGKVGTAPVNDTYAWDGTRWNLLPAGPSARFDAALGFDRARGALVLFGGRTGTLVLGDTWLLDAAGWRAATTTVQPRNRFGAGLAYDLDRQRLVLFGGAASPTSFIRDTWEWDGETWTQLDGATFPGGSKSAIVTAADGHGVELLTTDDTMPMPIGIAHRRWTAEQAAR